MCVGQVHSVESVEYNLYTIIVFFYNWMSGCTHELYTFSELDGLFRVHYDKDERELVQTV